MATVDFALTLDTADKHEAELFFNEYGMTLAEGIRQYIKDLLEKRKSSTQKQSDDEWFAPLIGVISLPKEEMEMDAKELLAKWRWEDYESLN